MLNWAMFRIENMYHNWLWLYSEPQLGISLDGRIMVFFSLNVQADDGKIYSWGWNKYGQVFIIHDA